MNKTLRETHPSVANELKSNNISENEWIRIIQKHTIDKSVLKNIIQREILDKDELHANGLSEDYNKALLLLLHSKELGLEGIK